MCEVALELGITPDLVVGTSTGAINAAVLAKSPANFHGSARENWHAVAQDKGSELNMAIDASGPGGEGSTTQTMLRKHLAATFGTSLGTNSKSRSSPLAPISNRVTPATQGDTIVNTLLSSAAFPIIMPPVSVDDQLLIDGSAVAGVPVSQAVAAGARSVIVFDTGSSAVNEDK